MDPLRPFVRASLDYRTKLVHGRWRVVVFPDAGEAVGVFQSAAAAGHSLDADQPQDAGPDRSAERRARGKIRRFCAANRLAYLWSATYRATMLPG
jgi:hypothetical protein